MAFTAQDVKALREQTGCGMMDCKRALTDADGDFDKAIELLREKGLAAQTKKAGRIAAEGMVYAEVDKEKKVGVVIEVNAETDFVAKNDKFKSLVYGAARAVRGAPGRGCCAGALCRFDARCGRLPRRAGRRAFARRALRRGRV